MDKLAPETLSRIFDFAVPKSSFKTFSERSSNLRAFALTCKAWREEAQRLLFLEPVIRWNATNEHELTGLFCSVEPEKALFLTHHFRVSGAEQERVLQPFSVGQRVAESLSNLTLYEITVDPNVLANLPCLEMLTLYATVFEQSSPPISARLAKLSELIVDNVHHQLPPILSAENMTSLKSLVLHNSYHFVGESNLELGLSAFQFSSSFPFDDIVSLQDQLDFFSCYDNNFNVEDLSCIADKTLFVTFRYNLGTDIPYFSTIKHLRIEDNDSITWLGSGYDWMTEWKEADLTKLISEKCPRLETLVVPGSWRHSPRLNDTRRMVEEKGIVFLVDECDHIVDEVLRSCSEGVIKCISTVFKKHRKQMREKSGTVAK